MILYYFQVYNIVIRHLCNLQSDHPSDGCNNHKWLLQYCNTVIQFCDYGPSAVLGMPEPALPFQPGVPRQSQSSPIFSFFSMGWLAVSDSYYSTSSLRTAALILSLTELSLGPDWLASNPGSVTCQLWATYLISCCLSFPLFIMRTTVLSADIVMRGQHESTYAKYLSLCMASTIVPFIFPL